MAHHHPWATTMAASKMQHHRAMPNPMMEEEDLVRFLSTMVDEEEQEQKEHLSLMELEGQEQALGVPETRMMQKTQQEQEEKEEVFKSIG
jgi:hypothetical protein